MRGEYSQPLLMASPMMELPPRARRIPARIMQANISLGTTSACAENTPAPWASIWNPWNYLRVRGEYLLQCLDCVQSKELPPRARRIPCGLIRSQVETGTTSACAENTGHVGHRLQGSWELPPRARRIHDEDDELPRYIGTTSACAENTTPTRTLTWAWRNYLRVRGEYSSTKV